MILALRELSLFGHRKQLHEIWIKFGRNILVVIFFQFFFFFFNVIRPQICKFKFQETLRNSSYWLKNVLFRAHLHKTWYETKYVWVQFGSWWILLNVCINLIWLRPKRTFKPVRDFMWPCFRLETRILHYPVTVLLKISLQQESSIVNSMWFLTENIE